MIIDLAFANAVGVGVIALSLFGIQQRYPLKYLL